MDIKSLRLIYNIPKLSVEMEIFTEKKVNEQYKKSLELIKKQLKNTFKSKLGPMLKDNTSDNDFFNFLKDMQTNILEPAAEKMSSNILLGASVKDLTNKNKNVKDFLPQLTKAMSAFKQALKTLEQSINSGSIIPYLQISDIIQNIQSEKITIDSAKQESRKYFLGSNYSFKVDAAFKNAYNKQKINIQKAYANLMVLQNIANQLKTSGISTIDHKVSNFINAFLWSTFGAIGKIMGIFSEEYMANDVIKFVDDFITKNLRNKIDSNNNITVSGGVSGTQKSSVFNVKTSDIEVAINIEDILKGKEGKVSIKLPGVSVKRTRSNTAKGASIKLKTGAKFTTFLDNPPLNNMDNKELSVMFSAMAAYRRRANKHYLYNNKKQMDYLYAFLKTGIFPMAIAGSLNEDDFAYFLVINDKVYNTLEILENMGDGMNLSNLTKLTFEPNLNKVPYNRQSLLDTVQRMKINYQLYLTLKSYNLTY